MSIRDGFLPFGPAHGDSVVPRTDDESSEEITLGTHIVLFDLRQDRLYVSHMICMSLATTLPVGSSVFPPLVANI